MGIEMILRLHFHPPWAIVYLNEQERGVTVTDTLVQYADNHFNTTLFLLHQTPPQQVRNSLSLNDANQGRQHSGFDRVRLCHVYRIFSVADPSR